MDRASKSRGLNKACHEAKNERSRLTSHSRCSTRSALVDVEPVPGVDPDITGIGGHAEHSLDLTAPEAKRYSNPERP
jgi:hypothetical protein